MKSSQEIWHKKERDCISHALRLVNKKLFLKVKKWEKNISFYLGIVKMRKYLFWRPLVPLSLQHKKIMMKCYEMKVKFAFLQYRKNYPWRRNAILFSKCPHTHTAHPNTKFYWVLFSNVVQKFEIFFYPQSAILTIYVQLSQNHGTPPAL